MFWHVYNQSKGFIAKNSRAQWICEPRFTFVSKQILDYFTDRGQNIQYLHIQEVKYGNLKLTVGTINPPDIEQKTVLFPYAQARCTQRLLACVKMCCTSSMSLNHPLQEHYQLSYINIGYSVLRYGEQFTGAEKSMGEKWRGRCDMEN